MTKVMKLNVTYYGNYGGDVNETLLLPMDINGVLFEELKEKTYDRTVYLGEIEGKHSEVYGDLEVEFIDLDELSIKQVTDLIKESNFGEFESFFEGAEDDFSDDENEYDKEKAVDIFNSYNVIPKTYNISTSLIHDQFIKKLEEKYVQNFKTVTVLEEDYEKVNELLDSNNIKRFD